MGGTGLEPVTPSLSSQTGQSAQVVRLGRKPTGPSCARAAVDQIGLVSTEVADKTLTSPGAYT